MIEVHGLTFYDSGEELEQWIRSLSRFKAQELHIALREHDYDHPLAKRYETLRLAA